LNGVTDDIESIHNGRIVGHEMANVINGPWQSDIDGLWEKPLAGGQKISALRPPRTDAVAMLNSSDVMLSVKKPEGISAQNVLQGSVTQLAVENDSGKVLVTVNVAGLSLVSRVTEKAVVNLCLLPGASVWVLFKASSLTWD
jgi:molybdopterin-binding protein